MGELENKPGIYKITNLITGRVYIGSAVKVRSRKNNHYSELRRSLHNNSHIQKSWNKYGEDNFCFEVLEYCSKKELRILETKYCEEYECLSNSGYNIADILEWNPHKSTKEIDWKAAGKKVSKALKGKIPKNLPLIQIKQKRAVTLYVDGVEHSTYESLTQASKELKLPKSTIQNNCAGKTLTIRNFPNYSFKYSDNLPSRKITLNKNSIGNRPLRKVIQLNKKGEFIKEFSSIKEAAKNNNLKVDVISNLCRGITKSSFQTEFLFKYKEDE